MKAPSDRATASAWQLGLRQCRRRARERGLALVMTLVLMVAVMLVGVSSVRAALGDEQSARHERDRQVALRAAEAALADAERELEATLPTSPRFAALAGAGFVDGCGKAGTDQHGLCTRLAPPSWQAIDLAGADSALVEYGTYTLRTLAGVARQPRYLVELLPLTPGYGRFYRITALGYGQRASTQVVLQSLYRKVVPAGAGPPPSTPPLPTTLPTKRIGWREVANWPALHDAVK